MRNKKIITFAMLTLLLPEISFGDNCYNLWFERNKIYAKKGYCFTSNLGKSVFVDFQCSQNPKPLSKEDKKQIDLIKSEEDELNCKVNTDSIGVSVKNSAIPKELQSSSDCRPVTPPESQYIIHDDNTTFDIKTGLTWKTCSEGLSGKDCSIGEIKSFTWDDANKHLAKVNINGFANHKDWRIPTSEELSELLFSYPNQSEWKGCSYQAINLNVFPNTGYLNDINEDSKNDYLTSTISPMSSTSNVVINTLNLLTSTYSSNVSTYKLKSSNRLRLVRGTRTGHAWDK
jgi:hypothetical protein